MFFGKKKDSKDKKESKKEKTSKSEKKKETEGSRFGALLFIILMALVGAVLYFT